MGERYHLHRHSGRLAVPGCRPGSVFTPVVGWAMGEQMDAELVEGAWQMALLNRQPPAGLLHHSDRGSQYTSEEYRDQLADLQCQVSMSRTGNCYDNAVMESFFATLKAECAAYRIQEQG